MFNTLTLPQPTALLDNITENLVSHGDLPNAPGKPHTQMGRAVAGNALGAALSITSGVKGQEAKPRNFRWVWRKMGWGFSALYQLMPGEYRDVGHPSFRQFFYD